MGLGAAAVTSGGLLAACSKEAGTKGAATATDKLAALMPAYRKMELVKPDIAGTPPVGNGFLTYPSSLIDAVTEKPSSGGAVAKAMTPFWGPVPPGLGSNSLWSAVNAKLGMDIDFAIQDGNTYGDKLSAILAARDVPDLLCVPGWEYVKIARFSDAVKALFEDLTDYLKGDAILKYPNLAAFTTSAWRNAVWASRLYAVPWPTDGPFPYALFYRKDLVDKLGVALPKNAQELYEFGKAVTDANKGVWAFNDIFPWVQIMHRVPGSEGGWRKESDGRLVYKYETPEFKASVEFMAKLFKEGLVHPDLVASTGSDSKQLFASGKTLTMMDGVGAWQGMYRDQRKVTPDYNMQAMPLVAHDGGTPLMWGNDKPIFFTFIRKGLGQARVEELLRVLNWCASPLGTKEFELQRYGVEGKHFTRGADGTPVTNDLFAKENAESYSFLAGRVPAIIGGSDVPNFVQDLLGWSNETVKYMEKNPFDGIKVEWPANYSKIDTPTRDKFNDIVRGRRPLSDVDTVVKEWRSSGGDEGRDLLAKVVSETG
jgi:putative aldouronate transport system substrate-binding protein